MSTIDHPSQHALHVLALAAITVAFFWQPLFTDETFFFRDLWRYYYPVRWVSVEQIQSGQIPLWNPYSSCGYPLLGTLTLGIFYPLGLIFLLLPFGLAFKHYIILHYFLAAVFAYALAAEWGLSAAAALFTALAFAFSGYFISLHSGFCYLASAVWMPLIVLLFHRTLRRRSVGYAALTGLALACQFLAGEAGTVLHTGIILAAYFCFFAFKGGAADNGLNVQRSTFNIQRSTAEHPPSIQNPKSKVQNGPSLIALLFVLAVTSAGLAMAQFLPSWELGGQSTRGGGYSLDLSAAGGFMLAHLPTIVAPFLFGNVYDSWWGGLFRVRDPFFNCIYLGLLPVVMACAAVALARRRLTIFLAVVGLLGLLLSLGTLTPLFYLFWKFVPMARMFRYPQKLFALTAFATPFLAGLAFDHLSVLSAPTARTMRRTLWAVGIFVALLWVTVAAFHVGADWFRDTLAVDRPKMQGDELAQQAYDHFAVSALKAAAGLTLALAFVVAVVAGKLSPARFRMAALVFLVAD
ncbi:MAG: hypothetical protein FJ279_33175, partial [Planctomycetes bacterium]|nr:hypothetical protein [Planctomycetota bacterium]